MERWDLIAAERRAFADLVDGLAEEQLAAPSLCERWTVKHVAAHVMVGPTASVAGVMKEMARARFNFNRANDALAQARVGLPVRELTRRMRDHAESRFSPPGMDWRAPMADILIHSQDVAVPLGLSFERPPEAWRYALDLLARPKSAKAFGGRPTRARLEATDVDWASGDGPLVKGPASALALALAGRSAGWERAEGPGLECLVGRGE
ncbi:MAG: maleylpyruvate isomerase family mycothiol-dependent enzyme [Aeromicrobium sp.]|uniref:maleylpyruvate isomerase family mycothiol-dependent enzyme n=1 Tax=Aeromicrobium sp. TaxID=1871063 RepID=UPI0039E3AB40